MPITYALDRVTRLLSNRKLDTSGTEQEQRERLASWVEDNFMDYVDAWEIRTGRPWTTMTSKEAADLIKLHPIVGRNPGVLSRLASVEKGEW